jgi:hypothetical protein
VGGKQGAVVEHAAGVITRETPVVDGPVLDAVAAENFRRSAVRLAREQPQTDEATEAARQAAEALIVLATNRDEAALGQFLRPDPRVAETTWTVACYQIGDLTPCALLDFANPVAAVNSLARCGDASHVAAEMVASTLTGTRWTAMLRTGTLVRFQLPDDRSASDETWESPGEMSLADRHWRDQLSQWAAAGGATAAARTTPAATTTTAAPVPRPNRDLILAAAKIPSRPVKAPPPRRGGRPDGAGLEQALELVIEALRTVEDRSQQAAEPAHDEILLRLDALDRRMSAFQASLDIEPQPPAAPAGDEILRRLDGLDRRMSEFQATVEEALEGRLQALASYSGELAQALAAQQNVTVGRLEARLDQLAALPPGDR